MGELPLALSLHKVVSSLGTDLAIAALVGLAILILLFFAQARETAGLRTRIEELVDRVGELEGRLAAADAASRPAVAPAPASVAAASPGASPAPAPAPAPAAATAAAPVELPPGPPAGVGAPALSAATRVIPVGAAVRAATSRQPVGVAAAAGGEPPTAQGASAAVRPSNGAGGGRVTPPPFAAPGSPPRASGAVAAAMPASGGRAGEVAREPYGRSAWMRFGVVLLTLAAIAAAAVLVDKIVNSTHTQTPASAPVANATQGSGHAARPAVAVVKPATVTVTVLNGTPTAGLAARVAQHLTQDGYRKGTVANAADQTRTATTVAYMPGHRAAALAVAKTLGLRPASVAPIDTGTRAVACGGAATCSTTVVVTVGSDYAGR